MATVKVKFRPSAEVGRAGTIVYYVHHARAVRQIVTKYKLYPEEWDETRARPVMGYSDGRSAAIQQIARGMEEELGRLEGIVEKYDRLGKHHSVNDIIAEFQGYGMENTLFMYMESVIERLRELNHLGTAKNYRAALSSFRRFRDGMDIPLRAIDIIVMEDYQAYLTSKGLTPNSISFYMRILRAVYRRAVEQGLADDYKPFRMVFTGIEKTSKRAISISDIKCVKNLDLTLSPHLEFARDIFLFLFLCRGMSFIDAAFLRKTDIHNDTLTYRRHKTGQRLHVKILPPIQELLSRYAKESSPYLLPLIPRPGNGERKQYEAALRRVNNGLKVIADRVNLSIPLTTYVARHAWATIAKSKNVPINVISDALGHDSIATTQIYLASIDTSVIDKANELIISDL